MAILTPSRCETCDAGRGPTTDRRRTDCNRPGPADQHPGDRPRSVAAPASICDNRPPTARPGTAPLAVPAPLPAGRGLAPPAGRRPTGGDERPVRGERGAHVAGGAATSYPHSGAAAG